VSEKPQILVLKLTLGELAKSAGTLLAELLPLHHAGIAGKKPLFLENRAKIRIKFDKSPCDSETDRAGLACKAPA
jgi:hypothetical protein